MACARPCDRSEKCSEYSQRIHRRGGLRK
jgi:hypothetical protein